MNKKNKPSGKRPAMFYQDGRDDSSLSWGPRIRIVYPNGKIEWLTLVDDRFDLFNEFSFKRIPCYLSDNLLTKARNFKDAIRIITKHDNEYKFAEMIFIGEL